MSTILFELGCEELPPKSLKPLRDALQASVIAQLTEADITFDSIKAFAAPRRLALQIQGISDKQPDRSEQKRGPAIKAAFDAEGNLSTGERPVSSILSKIHKYWRIFLGTRKRKIKS